MLDRAMEQATNLNAKIRYVCYVPGVFDMPLMVKELLKKKDIDAVVTLGAVIKGETRHDDIVAENSARLFAGLSLEFGKPVALGISGPGMTVQQARERIGFVPTHAVSAAVNMAHRIARLQRQQPGKKKSLGSGVVIID